LLAFIIFPLTVSVVHLVFLGFHSTYQHFYNSPIIIRTVFQFNQKTNESDHKKCFRQADNVYFVHFSFWTKLHCIHPDLCNRLKTYNNQPIGMKKKRQVGSRKLFCLIPSISGHLTKKILNISKNFIFYSYVFKIISKLL
jgi:hypothetical protein